MITTKPVCCEDFLEVWDNSRKNKRHGGQLSNLGICLGGVMHVHGKGWWLDQGGGRLHGIFFDSLDEVLSAILSLEYR